MSSPNVRGSRLTHSSSQTASFIPKEQIPTADIHPKVKLQAFGNATKCASTINFLSTTFIKHANKWLFQAGNFEVISYHARNGLTIPNCLDADGDLKETEDQAPADRRPANIQFAHLSSDICFTAINKDDKQPHPFSYFVRLPMELEVVPDDNGNDVHLYTFQGHPEWATDNDQENLDESLRATPA
eukprot:scaffold72101_cov55-Attheya_sp.AAC.2